MEPTDMLRGTSRPPGCTMLATKRNRLTHIDAPNSMEHRDIHLSRQARETGLLSPNSQENLNKSTKVAKTPSSKLQKNETR